MLIRTLGMVPAFRPQLKFIQPVSEASRGGRALIQTQVDTSATDVTAKAVATSLSSFVRKFG